LVNQIVIDMSVILVDTEGMCFCSCATKCVLGHIGSSIRCQRKALEAEGYKVIQVVDKKSEKAVHDAMTADGYSHKFKIKDKKYK
jgi:hypothetical protein